MPALFDTGASTMVIDPALIKKYPKSFRYIEYQNMIDANGKSYREERYWLKNLRLGRLVINDTLVTTLHSMVRHPNSPDDFGIVFGAKQMQHLRWIFDLKNSTWTVW